MCDLQHDMRRKSLPRGQIHGIERAQSQVKNESHDNVSIGRLRDAKPPPTTIIGALQGKGAAQCARIMKPTKRGIVNFSGGLAWSFPLHPLPICVH